MTTAELEAVAIAAVVDADADAEAEAEAATEAATEVVAATEKEATAEVKAYIEAAAHYGHMLTLAEAEERLWLEEQATAEVMVGGYGDAASQHVQRRKYRERERVQFIY